MSEISSAAIVLLGIGTVFVGLAGLVICCKVMGYFLYSSSKNSLSSDSGNPKSVPEAASAPPILQNEGALAEAPKTGGAGMELAISAALAEMTGADISDIRIRSIRHISGSTETIPNRQQLIAAISAAIAEMLGTDVSRIRIHSFRKI